MMQKNVDKAPYLQPHTATRIGYVPLVLAIGIFVIFFTSIAFSREKFLPKPVDGHYWKMVFADEFDGVRLNDKHWVSCYDWYDAVYKGCTNHGNDERQWYTAGQVSVANGIATLTAKQQPTKGWAGTYERIYPYTSGMISTGRNSPHEMHRWSTQYGYYEARMKVDGGRGIWPAFWLLPVDGSWPPEIDIMEVLGHEPNKVRMTYHWPQANGKPAKDESVYISSDFTKDWHIYSVEWLPDSIRWYIDGKLRKQVSGKSVPDKPMELIINLAVGGRLPGNPDASTAFPAKVQIDYVHAYQLTKQ